jgi:hypothetical protein
VLLGLLLACTLGLVAATARKLETLGGKQRVG